MTKDADNTAHQAVRALCATIASLASDDPKAARMAVQYARDELDDAEAAAIRAALERFQWRVAPAAELLGYPRVSALQKLLEPGRRHEAIGKEVERQRKATGYHTGRPPTPKQEADIPPTGQKATARRGRNTPRG